jgi:hypothetical protein
VVIARGLVDLFFHQKNEGESLGKILWIPTRYQATNIGKTVRNQRTFRNHLNQKELICFYGLSHLEESLWPILESGSRDYQSH